MSLDIRQGDWLSALRSPVKAITTTATAKAWSWNYVTGTSAAYTVTIPPAASFKDGFIGFRMGPIAALSKIITLDGNSSETIDDALTRDMWASESAVLYSDGSNLFKIAGRALPMIASMGLSSSMTGISAGSNTKVLLDRIDIDNTGLMCSTSNHEVTLKRASRYLLSGRTRWAFGPSVICRAAGGVFLTSTAGTQVAVGEQAVNTVGGCYPVINSVAIYDGAVGDVLLLEGDYDAGSGQGIYGAAAQAGSTLSVTEMPSW